MAIFDLEKDDLLRLSDVQLEELIARLSEAEVAKLNHSPACVSWSGSIKAPDGGIDIHVQIPSTPPTKGFLVRSDTVFQSKKNSMPKSAIPSEMRGSTGLSPMISRQAENGGSYIIVSLADDCSPTHKEERLQEMRTAVLDDPNKMDIHLDFYDRSKLLLWLRQHPSVMLWVKGKLGQGYSGWQPYGSWSNPPKDADDTLISAPGVNVLLPSLGGQKLSIGEAIAPMRQLVRSSSKAIRVTGLSGVGKTRIVQALFDETIGETPLDRTIAVYVDTGDDPDPSASAMMDRLIAEGRKAIVVLDNCPSELHSALAGKVSASSGNVRLITVEYDIRDDKPQTTEVVHIEADGPEVAKELLLRRFPSIGQGNARRIAEFADGNTRVSLAIAERVEQGESLAQLSDAELFDRLFEQRKERDGNLREQAETLSLVYSFSMNAPQDGLDELAVLGTISGHTKAQLFRSVKKLSDRHVVQKRSHWRAILPHAIANRLASTALESIPVETLREVFEAPGRQRLLMSFAHRLGLMHDHPVAKEIVETWLQPVGLLGRISDLDEVGARILDYIGPVAPDALLNRIEMELTAPEFQGMEPRQNPRRSTIPNLLQSLAYEPEMFDRCIKLLIGVADHEDGNKNYDAVCGRISGFFQPFLSGTHASLDQRVAVVERCLSSNEPARRSIGLKLLSTALEGPPWTSVGMNEFGARPRDFGHEPNHEQLVEWRSMFIDIAVRLGTTPTSDVQAQARQVLADVFRGLWDHEALRGKLIAAAHQINNQQSWGEGWKAVRSVVFLDYTSSNEDCDPLPVPKCLADLERALQPNDLMSKIRTFVLGNDSDHWELDPDFGLDGDENYQESEGRLAAKARQLGKDFAASTHQLDELRSELFSGEHMPYRNSFGKGLASGAHDLREGWAQLISAADQESNDCRDVSVIAGFIAEVASFDHPLSREFLDECAGHSVLRQHLVWLHQWDDFSEVDLDRCTALLAHDDSTPLMIAPLLWRDEFAHLPEERLVELANWSLAKPNGENVLLFAFRMRLHRGDASTDVLGPHLRKLCLQAAIQKIRSTDSDRGASVERSMERVIDAALRFEGNEAEKEQWIDAVFEKIDERHGYIWGVEKAIANTAALVPDAFLDRILQGDEQQQSRRSFFIQGVNGRNPLSRVKASALISWCVRQTRSDIWGVVASGMRAWDRHKETAVATLNEGAVDFLLASPEPGKVLQAFALKTERGASWTRDAAVTLQSRVDAILELKKHKRADIAAAAGSVADNLNKTITEEQERVQQWDEDREQRFE